MAQGILWAVITKPVTINRRFPVGEPHHITLRFGVEREDVQQYEGREFVAYIIEECWNEKIQALKVILPTSIPHDSDRIPHITVSRADGVEPVESNLMLDQCHQSQKFELFIPCRIEFLEWAEPIYAEETRQETQTKAKSSPGRLAL